MAELGKCSGTGEMTDVHVSCNLCGCNHTDLLYRINGLRIVRCRVCDLVYLNPRDEEEGAERNRTRHPVAHSGPLAERQRREFQDRARRIEGILGRTGRMLDVGCAAGGFVALARERGWSVAGAEASEPASTYARAALGQDVVTGGLQDVPDEYGAFDVVTLWDVLQRVPDPKGVLTRARDRLVQDGVVGLSVPNISSVGAWLGGCRWPVLRDGDLIFFSA